VLVARPTQWLFRKDEAGAHVHAVISGADEWVALDEEEITRRVVEDVVACFPAARGAKVVSSRPVKEKLATFAPTPEVERLRPRTLGARGVEGIVLAGDYVQTGWPATMEGATRSGYMAAAAVLGEDVEGAVLPGLRRGFVAGMLMHGA
jgi:zeta-carotene desaturase